MTPKIKYTVTVGTQKVFTVEDLWYAAHNAVEKFLTNQLIITNDVDVEMYGRHLISSDDDSSSAAFTFTTAAKQEMEKYIKAGAMELLLRRNNPNYNTNPGDKGSSPKAFITVAWECTGKGRRPNRPKAVIEAEKAKQSVKQQARAAEREKYQREADQRTINLRNRIKQQVDHAFALGKHGTEPAAKYITCQHCDAPAAVVCLNQPPARGATVVDEDTIVGALCDPHISSSPWSYYSRHNKNKNVAKVPCSKLEFFYDGVRQIAIKP